ncbi:MAG: polyhydroxyalkanoate synthesis regulator DNA-binding domain-containing protein [Chloroflexota bacterium]
MAAVHLVKRYSNRKLYDTLERRAITLEGIAQLVRAGQDVKVIDNDSEEDISTVVLTQILLERERHAASPASKTVLTGLVQAGTATFGQFRRTITGMGLVQLAEQETERVINTAIELGHLTETEVLRSVESVIERRRQVRGDAAGLVEERIVGALKRADVPTRDEFNRLLAQLHSLSVQLSAVLDELRKARPSKQG